MEASRVDSSPIFIIATAVINEFSLAVDGCSDLARVDAVDRPEADALGRMLDSMMDRKNVV